MSTVPQSVLERTSAPPAEKDDVIRCFKNHTPQPQTHALFSEAEGCIMLTGEVDRPGMSLRPQVRALASVQARLDLPSSRVDPFSEPSPEREGGLYFGDVTGFYQKWPAPIVIISDGPYGLGGYPGDVTSPEGLVDWYRPHVEQWTNCSTPQTTLWFWNSELGWATVHPLLSELGWNYRACHVWDKGVEHIAGNANTKTLRKFPVVTEVCVQYVHEPKFNSPSGDVDMQEWLRSEWSRSGLPFYRANEACGVKNAATRKYLTADRLWYYPPVEAFVHLSEFANLHGKSSGAPYFSLDGHSPLTGDQWSRMRAKFHCEFGVSNVWREPPVNGNERIKSNGAAVHLNQKPLRLLELSIKASSDPGDVVWEPFGGTCSVAVAAGRLGRPCFSAEISPEYYEIAVQRLRREQNGFAAPKRT